MVGKSCRVAGAKSDLCTHRRRLALMAAPVLAANPDGFAARLDGLLKALPAASDDLLKPDAVSAMIQAGMTDPDSLHRLVMDLHKRLNAMQAELAEETLDGAAVYNLAETDRPLVTAFMGWAQSHREAEIQPSGPGHHRHPRCRQIVIQNDIGTTDAHVIVIHVQDLTVSVTYTDRACGAARVLPGPAETARVTWESDRTPRWPPGTRFIWRPGVSRRRMPTAVVPISNFLAHVWSS